MSAVIGLPPTAVTGLLRVEGLAIGIASLVAFGLTGGNWWLYLLVLAPDLSFVGLAFGPRRGAWIYNLAHSYAGPLVLICAGLLVPVSGLLWAGLIWTTHIGVDRALGYGMKYPDAIETTHLGLIGRARKAGFHADAR